MNVAPTKILKQDACQASTIVWMPNKRAVSWTTREISEGKEGSQTPLDAAEHPGDGAELDREPIQSARHQRAQAAGEASERPHHDRVRQDRAASSNAGMWMAQSATARAIFTPPGVPFDQTVKDKAFRPRGQSCRPGQRRLAFSRKGRKANLANASALLNSLPAIRDHTCTKITD